MSIGSNTAAELKAIVERIERLEDEKATIAADIKEVFSEAKATGFDVKILRKVIALRKVDPAAREETRSLIDTYMHALGDAGDDEEALV
jgi:uncharacterized protein (UPF0335 family)